VSAGAALFLVDGVGLWAQRLTGAAFAGRPAVFLDRDGVITQEVHFLRRPADVRLTEGVAAAIAALNAQDVAVVAITNQSGVARGRLSWEDFAAVQDEIARQLAREGAQVDAIFACGYHPDGTSALAVADHPWRKPAPGMLFEARARLGVDLARSFVVGDRRSDLEAGRAAGVPRGVLVRTGYGEAEAAGLPAIAARWGPGFAAEVAEDAARAIGRWLATR
jgi:D-glycero-D-manno-heptose 1,7-bisphosphate phosphatase